MRYALQYYSVTAHKQTERLQCGYPEFVYFGLESNFNCLKSLSLHFCTKCIHSKTFTKSWTYVESLLCLVKMHMRACTHTHITYIGAYAYKLIYIPWIHKLEWMTIECGLSHKKYKPYRQIQQNIQINIPNIIKISYIINVSQ
jgi:hypothetical protein